MITLTKSLARVALAFEAGKINQEDATVLCSDLMGIYDDRNNDRLTYYAAWQLVIRTLTRAGIDPTE